jgi:V/A-type H+-transporting ATPase subunit I
MILRPATAGWFDLLSPREELEGVLLSLAATGNVELQSRVEPKAAHGNPAFRAATEEYRRLEERYAAYWPPAEIGTTPRAHALETIPDEALRRLRSWEKQADPLICRSQALAHERSELELLRCPLSDTQLPLPSFELFDATGPILQSRIYRIPSDMFCAEDRAASEHANSAEDSSPVIPHEVLLYSLDCGVHHFALAVGASEAIETLDRTLATRKAQRLELPGGLPASREGALSAVTERLEKVESELNRLTSQVRSVGEQHGIAHARADMIFLEWWLNWVPELTGTDQFIRVTGWTRELSSLPIQRALGNAQLQGLVRVHDPPRDLKAPVILRNPRWARPFELFERLLGVPEAREVDPSVILALVAPLLFGFMFGDVGQGAVLLIAGIVLRRKYPLLKLLIPGGIAAMLFGVLFGSVFTREDWLPAVWLRPMQQPIIVLRVSVIIGAGVIGAGLALDALQHAWAGKARQWWSTRAGLAWSYVTAISGALLNSRILWAVPAGILWSWIGCSAQAPSARMKALAAGIGESLQILLQMFVNTISFVRVGAFALAHAGLAATVVALASGTHSWPLRVLVLLSGNALIIIAEGLIVGIQTTRLVLFEFFVRFLHGTGRPFRPLPQPFAARGSTATVPSIAPVSIDRASRTSQ